MRTVLLVLDSVGIGPAPDAGDYGDTGAHTLAHTATAVGGLKLPTLARLGLGNIPGLLPDSTPIDGVSPASAPQASYGAMRELSRGKDTTTGHWEMAGLLLEEGFGLFPSIGEAFPKELLDEFERRTGRGILGNRAASGIRIIEELGKEQLESGKWIVYTSADSVFQVAAHEEIIPLEELYRACEIARELCNPLRIGRVIARPFVGQPGAFERTENRRDFSYPLPEPTIMDILSGAGVHVVTVGKLDDVFAHRGMDEKRHVENNRDAQAALHDLWIHGRDNMFVFANFIDFDMLYGHRRDAAGYAACLEDTDAFLAEFIPRMIPGDILIITADHGNDPTFAGTDHTRELVPLLVLNTEAKGEPLGIRNGFYDIAQSIAHAFGLPPIARGKSFLPGPVTRG